MIGLNKVGAAGQDLSSFMSPIIANSQRDCFGPGTFPVTHQVNVTNIASMDWEGIPGATIFQQPSNTNIPKALFRFNGTSLSNIGVHGITFDFNKAGNPGSPAYTCPNAGFILQIDPANTAGTRFTVTGNEFKN